MQEKQIRSPTPLKIISSWRRYVDLVVKAVSKVKPEAQIYLIGGAAENRLTILSDIDLLIVLPRKPSFSEAAELRTKILEKAVELGLPLYAPVELHIIGEKELADYAKRGRIVRIK